MMSNNVNSEQAQQMSIDGGMGLVDKQPEPISQFESRFVTTSRGTRGQSIVSNRPFGGPNQEEEKLDAEKVVMKRIAGSVEGKNELIYCLAVTGKSLICLNRLNFSLF